MEPTIPLEEMSREALENALLKYCEKIARARQTRKFARRVIKRERMKMETAFAEQREAEQMVAHIRALLDEPQKIVSIASGRGTQDETPIRRRAESA